MERYDVINRIVEKKNIGTYLEIGVRNPYECFHKINCKSKWSVDPGYESGGDNQATYSYTSDDFFRELDNGNLDLPPYHKWDLIFIDGLHISDQVYRDFVNARNHLSEGGYMVFHDCNPPTHNHAREDYHDHDTPAEGWWNGTVWKAIQRIRTEYDISMATVSSDFGVGVMRFHGELLPRLPHWVNPFYDFKKFDENRVEILNLIEPEQFDQWL